MSSSGSTAARPIRERTEGEVLRPLMDGDQAFEGGSDDWDWDVDFGISVRAKIPEVFKMRIPMAIDPEGTYKVETDPRAVQPPPAVETSFLPVSVVEPVGLLLVQGEMRIPHQRSKDDPPVPFVEGESEEESDEDEGEVPSGKVSKKNVATLGLSDKTVVPKFCSVLDPHVPAGSKK